MRASFRTTRRPPHGISLIELMVAMAVMSVMLLIVSQIFIADYNLVQGQVAHTDTVVGTMLATRAISTMARGAVGVMATQTINGTSYTSSTSTLVLKLPAINATGDVINNTYDYVAFARDGSSPTKIFADVQAASGSARISLRRLITAYNSQLAFRYNAADITKATRVQIYLVNSEAYRNSTLTDSAWTALYLRNTTF